MNERDRASEGQAAPVVIESLTKQFRQGTGVVTALEGVSLTVSRGEFVAVMGASGSGKSTLLHLAAGLTRPDAGRVVIDGDEITSMAEPALTHFRRRKIGLVFQSFNLIPTLTAIDNVALPLLADASGYGAAETAQALLERLGLSARQSHRPDALSGGEQQRVAIARALAADPAIILADEPTGSLDSITGQEICRLLRDLVETQQRTIIIVTHEPAVAAWADRVIVLRDGRRRAEFFASEFADPQELAARYQHLASEPPAVVSAPIGGVA